jgi:thymidine phosphorylase
MPNDLENLCIALSAQMIRLGGRARTAGQAAKMAYSVVSSGEAAQRLRDIIRLQGGDERIVDDLSLLPKASNIEPLRASQNGFIARCDAKLLGLGSNALGAGRSRVEDVIDPAVGIYLEKKIGDKVTRGETLCYIHWNDERRLREAMPMIEQAYEVKPRAPRPRPLIRAVLEN